MRRVRLEVGAIAPLLMLGAWACGSQERAFVNDNTPDTGAVEDVTVDRSSTVDAAIDAGPEAASDVTRDGPADRAPDTGRDGAIDAPTPDAITADVPATGDTTIDLTSDSVDDMSSDANGDDTTTDGSGDVQQDADAPPPPCEPVGGYRCTGLYLQQCTVTGWEDRLTCPSAPLCDAVGGTCSTPVCQPNSYRCNGTTLQICNADQNGWLDKETCPSAALCDSTGGKCGTSACTPGAYQCSGAVLQQCRSDQTGWDNVNTCATSALCNAAGGTCNAPACTAGEYQCLGSALQQCNSDRTGWTTVNTCATAALCNAAGANCVAPACAANDYQCVNATLQVCNADQTGWATAQVCLSQGLCDAAAKACKPSCTNLAPLATPYSSGGGTTVNHVGPEGLNDGILGCATAGTTAGSGGWHWITNGLVPGGTAYFEYYWSIPQTIAMIHIDTANSAAGCGAIGTGRSFKGATVQYWNGSAWQSIGTIAGQSNDFDFVFPGGPVTMNYLRLYDVYSVTVANTPVMEWQTYATTGCSSPYDP